MQKNILKRIESLEKDLVFEIEDLSGLYKEIFGENSEQFIRYEEGIKNLKQALTKYKNQTPFF